MTSVMHQLIVSARRIVDNEWNQPAADENQLRFSCERRRGLWQRADLIERKGNGREDRKTQRVASRYGHFCCDWIEERQWKIPSIATNPTTTTTTMTKSSTTVSGLITVAAPRRVSGCKRLVATGLSRLASISLDRPASHEWVELIRLFLRARPMRKKLSFGSDAHCRLRHLNFLGRIIFFHCEKYDEW